MTYPRVHSSASGSNAVGTTHVIPLPAGAGSGDRIVVILQLGGNPVTDTWPADWHALSDAGTPISTARQEVRYFDCTGSPGASINVTTSAACSSATVSFLIRDHDTGTAPAVATPATGTATTSATPPNPPSLTSGFGPAETLWLAIAGGRLADDFTAAPSGYSGLTQGGDPSPTLGCYAGMAYLQATAASENPGTMPLSYYAADRGWVAVTVAIKGYTPPFTAEFDASPTSGTVPLAVDFDDQSFGGTGTANSWSWDFGDGSTSTSQNPSHTYTVTGNYTVTLTVGTTTAESDSVSHGITAGDAYVPPPPGNAVIEIYVDAPGSYRWDEANWDEAVWAESAWVDVTPQSVEAVVRWGSHQPERGILAETEAGSWSVDTYDPDRILDPGNQDGPYVTDLRAGLPIRIRHRGTIVRQGICETIAYFHADKSGGIRATDNVSTLARTPVPDDTMLSDTLRARARDVIAAAGLRITVEPDPPSGDPALAPRLEGVRSAWRHVSDAAEQVLHIAYVDRLGTLRFRAWDSPYDRSRFVDSTNLIDLGTIVQTSGLYSVVQAVDSITELVEERRLTPTPQYGSVTYTRNELTPDAGAWAAAVLADRAIQTVQWIPGEILPLTADEVEYFALMENLEKLDVLDDDATPTVAVTGNIIGGEFRVISKKESEALWRFTLELAQTATAEQSPLVDDVDGEFLLNELEDAYLYAD